MGSFRVRHDPGRWWLFVAITGVLVALAATNLLFQLSWGWLGVAFIYALNVPLFSALARSPGGDVAVDDAGLVLRFDGLLAAPVRIARGDVEAVIPLWLWPDGRSLLGLRRPVLTVRAEVPVVGNVGRGRGELLAIVLREPRRLPEAPVGWISFLATRLRREKPVRALLLAVEDHEAAQRPFLGWPGVLRSLDDETFARLEAR